ncbi:MAG TPA: L,D-transpeptidase [Elusimicrobiota bacterium]|nr:L,D-transpeptidase [Elusimicrobiota bacterium]
MKHFSRIVLGLWLAAFAAESASVALWSSRLEKSRARLENLAHNFSRVDRLRTEAAKQIKAQSREMKFLQNLPNLLPKDKGYLRTQRAIADEVEALRRKLSWRLRGRLYIVVDAKAEKLYLERGFRILMQTDCSVGRGELLVDKKTGRRWRFVTPLGEFHVLAKAANPLWRKPDWAYVEEGQPIPPPDSPERLVSGELGAYLLSLGDGYLIHGVKDEKTLGRPASHGCVHLSAAALKELYNATPVGTPVFIIE